MAISIGPKIIVRVSSATRSIPFENVLKREDLGRVTDTVSTAANLTKTFLELSNIRIKKETMQGITLYGFLAEDLAGQYQHFALINELFNPKIFKRMSDAGITGISAQKGVQDNIPHFLQNIYKPSARLAGRANQIIPKVDISKGKDKILVKNIIYKAVNLIELFTKLHDVVVTEGDLFGIRLFSFMSKNKSGDYKPFTIINKFFNPILFNLLNEAHVSNIHFPKGTQKNIKNVFDVLFENPTNDVAIILFREQLGKLYNLSMHDPNKAVGQE